MTFWPAFCGLGVFRKPSLIPPGNSVGRAVFPPKRVAVYIQTPEKLRVLKKQSCHSLLAQLVEQTAVNRLVAGSSPAGEAILERPHEKSWGLFSFVLFAKLQIDIISVAKSARLRRQGRQYEKNRNSENAEEPRATAN